jgi:hypothetical protein
MIILRLDAISNGGIGMVLQNIESDVYICKFIKNKYESKKKSRCARWRVAPVCVRRASRFFHLFSLVLPTDGAQFKVCPQLLMALLASGLGDNPSNQERVLSKKNKQKKPLARSVFCH